MLKQEFLVLESCHLLFETTHVSLIEISILKSASKLEFVIYVLCYFTSTSCFYISKRD